LEQRRLAVIQKSESSSFTSSSAPALDAMADALADVIADQMALDYLHSIGALA
jgi:hypothetical protein